VKACSPASRCLCKRRTATPSTGGTLNKNAVANHWKRKKIGEGHELARIVRHGVCRTTVPARAHPRGLADRCGLLFRPRPLYLRNPFFSSRGADRFPDPARGIGAVMSVLNHRLVLCCLGVGDADVDH